MLFEKIGTRTFNTYHLCKITKSYCYHFIVEFRFEAKFGDGRTIPAAVATRWNSTYKQIKTLIKMDGMDYKALAEVCNTQEFSNALPSRHEWGQLNEVCEILEPFAEATDLTQGKNFL